MPTDRPQRKTIRLPNCDYSSEGAYFVTLCTKGKAKLLCHYMSPKMGGDAPILCLTPIGSLVDDMIRLIPGIDKHVIMPNHVHLITAADFISNAAGSPCGRLFAFGEPGGSPFGS